MQDDEIVRISDTMGDLHFAFQKVIELEREISLLRSESPSKKKAKEAETEILNQIEEAWQTLNHTWNELDVMLKPGVHSSTDPLSLTHIIQKLRDEAEIG